MRYPATPTWPGRLDLGSCIEMVPIPASASAAAANNAAIAEFAGFKAATGPDFAYLYDGPSFKNIGTTRLVAVARQPVAQPAEGRTPCLRRRHIHVRRRSATSARSGTLGPLAPTNSTSTPWTSLCTATATCGPCRRCAKALAEKLLLNMNMDGWSVKLNLMMKSELHILHATVLSYI